MCITIYIPFSTEKIVMPTKLALCGTSIRKPLCGWLMRGSYAERFFCEKTFMRSLMLHKAQGLMRETYAAQSLA